MVIAISSSSIGTIRSLQVCLKSSWSLPHIGIRPSEDIVGTHALVGRAVAVEVLHEMLGERVVGHHGVGTVLPLQLLELGAHLAAVARTGGVLLAVIICVIMFLRLFGYKDTVFLAFLQTFPQDYGNGLSTATTRRSGTCQVNHSLFCHFFATNALYLKKKSYLCNRISEN